VKVVTQETVTLPGDFYELVWTDDNAKCQILVGDGDDFRNESITNYLRCHVHVDQFGERHIETRKDDGKTTMKSLDEQVSEFRASECTLKAGPSLAAHSLTTFVFGRPRHQNSRIFFGVFSLYKALGLKGRRGRPAS
jgi:hypothetical protein